MIKSMTAYGRASKAAQFGRFVVEVHSVNRKMLDVSVYLPKDLIRFEVEVRKWLSAQLERGQITVRIALQQEEAGGRTLHARAAQLKALKESWDQIAHDLKLDPKMVDLRFLVDQMQTLSPVEEKEDEEEMRKALKEAVDGALAECMGMKIKEGQALKQDIEKRLQSIEKSIKTVESRKDEPLTRYRIKIKERLQEFSPMGQEIEERILREVALLAEKLDVTEEIVRLHSHIQQFRTHLASEEKSVGRTLDFLTQEMNREINTLAAKSADTEASALVVQMKSELEKIREQVQNIE